MAQKILKAQNAKDIPLPKRAVQQINGREGETATLLSRCLVSLSLRVVGFTPRHLNRSMPRGNAKCEIMKLMNFKILILFFVFTFLFGTTAAYACRTVRPSTTAMVENAEVIVRVEADKYIEEPKGDIRALNEPSNATINFKVKETLKGDSVPSEIILNGYLSDADDFNETDIPYNFVRRGGRGGSCSAYEYKKGAEFLLFLKKVDGKYTVRWYALAPTNEQLHSSNDKWITWVRNYLKGLQEKEAREK